MVKFGRHVDFFVANELDSSRKLYVVPYKDVQHKTCIELPKQQVVPPPPPATSVIIPSSSRNGSRAQTPEPRPKNVVQPSPAATKSKSAASGLSALFDKPQQSLIPPTIDADLLIPPTASAELINPPLQQQPAAQPPAVPDLYSKDLTNSPRIIKPAGVSAYDLTPDVVANLKQQSSSKDSPKSRSVLKGNAVTLTAGTGAELAAAVKRIQISQQIVKNPTIMIPESYGYDDNPCNNNTAKTPNTDNTTETTDEEELENNVGENKDTVKLSNKQAAELSSQLSSSKAPSTKPATTEPNSNQLLSSKLSEEEKQHQAHFFAQRFTTEWRICLKKASVDFDRAMQLFWSEVFEGVSSYNNNQNNNNDDSDDESKVDQQPLHNFEESIRGALPDAALQMYVQAVPPSRAQTTFSFLKDIHATALINAEALRKLVKKFDKMHYKLDSHSYLLSAKLLPEVYASNFTGALASLEAGLAVLRMLLQIDEDDDNSLATAEDYDNVNENSETLPKAIRDENRRLRKLATMDDDLRDVAVLSGGYFGNKKDTDAELVKRRMKELQWLRQMIEGIDPAYIGKIVGHRGFHSIHDRSDVRPLENSLMAYEAAWTNGVHLCECDIALTKDERIILAHDENFKRLGMDPTSPLANRTVRDLTFKELMSLPLKTGARPPLLFDVLRSAMAIGGDAKMIVEIKAGNTEAGPALARMFVRHPQLMEHVAVVMSFDAFIMHNLRREMAAVFEQLHQNQNQNQEQLVPPPAIKSASIPISHELEYDNVGPGENPTVHPLKAPQLSNIALGSTLSSSPNLGPSIMMGTHNRAPSHLRVPSKIGLGHHNRLDSRDMFGLGMRIGGGGPADKSAGELNLGMNLAEIDTSMSQSSSFLPIHKSVSNLDEDDVVAAASEEEKKEKDAPSPSNNDVSVPPRSRPGMLSVLSNDGIKSFPKLLLITVAEAPKADYELFVDITKPEKVAELDGWLRGGDGGTLDGVYMQYQKAMMGPEGSKTMRNLASRYDVGIWGANPVPDDWDTFHTLVTECHVSYVNSSLPKHFRRKMKRSMSANTLQLNAAMANH